MASSLKFASWTRRSLSLLEFLKVWLLLLSNSVLTLGKIAWFSCPSLLLVTVWFSLKSWLVFWISSDGSMAFFVHGLNTSGSDSVLNVFWKLFLVRIFIISLQWFHVVGNMKTHNVLSVNISVVFALSKSWESLGALKNKWKIHLYFLLTIPEYTRIYLLFYFILTIYFFLLFYFFKFFIQ